MSAREVVPATAYQVVPAPPGWWAHLNDSGQEYAHLWYPVAAWLPVVVDYDLFLQPLVPLDTTGVQFFQGPMDWHVVYRPSGPPIGPCADCLPALVYVRGPDAGHQ